LWRDWVLGVIDIKTKTSPGRSGRIRLVASLLAVAGLLVAAPAAHAQAIDGDDPTGAQYGSTLDLISSGGEAENAAPAPPTAPAAPTDAGVGALPFTGLDVALLVVVAVALAGSGVLIRRLAGAPGR
jgi:hypothetical protein